MNGPIILCIRTIYSVFIIYLFTVFIMYIASSWSSQTDGQYNNSKRLALGSDKFAMADDDESKRCWRFLLKQSSDGER